MGCQVDKHDFGVADDEVRIEQEVRIGLPFFAIAMVFFIVVAFLLGVAMLVIVVVVALFLAMTMMVFLAIDKFIGTGHCNSQLDDLSPFLQIGLSQLQCRGIEMHSVYEDQIGLRQFHGIGWSRLERMRVGPRRHDSNEIDTIAPDIVDNVCNRGE